MAAAADSLAAAATASLKLCATGSGIRTVIYNQGLNLSFSVRPQLQALVNGVLQQHQLLEDVIQVRVTCSDIDLLLFFFFKFRFHDRRATF